jgi:hypothetical protein
MTCPNNNRIYNIGFRSSDPIEKILSNLAHTPFKIEINNQIISCQSVEGFWQGLKLEGKEREKTFQLYGFPAKFAGKGIKRERFEICGLEIETGSIKHRMLIHNAVYEKVVQNKLVYNALIETKGQLVHNVPGKPIFKIEEILKAIYNQFAWSSILTEKVLH